MPWYDSASQKRSIPLSFAYDNVMEVISRNDPDSKELRKLILGSKVIDDAPFDYSLLSLIASAKDLVPVYMMVKLPLHEQAKWLAYQQILNKVETVSRFNDEMDKRQKKAIADAEAKQKSTAKTPKKH